MSIESLVFSADHIISDIVIRFPKSSDYFRDRKIDFCCGGKRPLKDAVEQRGLEMNQVLEELNHLAATYAGLHEDQDSMKNFVEMDSPSLINYIVKKHHDYLREELPEINKNVVKINRVHGSHDLHLAQVYVLYTRLKDELLEHTTDEEERFFPRMIALEHQFEESARTELQDSIAQLEDEHDTAGDILKEIREITNDFTPPAHACTTYRLTYDRLAELERMTYEHVHLENNILFPRFQA
ncbi:iron-sulfur cluster repair di-iron protein [Paenibacillus crassostreae]|uniref:Iron-sulfur cluster repair di-iron protein n=1 Tax=Paenibacillus crassostreae TaxID=1763538 RepID=A0A167DGP8_9BACL|nr:iron-sulfur cluster repair di-iron protein [Paenibacillus crassostreae]AOZ91493.1 iron-sulfur cluster repair di-iron protein [Paenibacillus crassostreae]OAB74348.1 iron-sulfur cluster repair di-iron protein [Paenibacillus crassostreae]